MIETVVAFAIAAGSLTLLYQVHANSARVVALATERAFAQELAESIIAEIHRTEASAQFGRNGVAEEKYVWQATVVPFEDELALVDLLSDQSHAFALRRLSVVITWQSAYRERSLSLEVLKPAWSEETDDPQ